MIRKKLIVLGHVGVVACLLAFGWHCFQSPKFHRPFDIDELLTVRYYTWVGIYPSGEQRDLRHIDDFYALGTPSVRQLGMGVYCSMGRWPEPNNHVLNSLLANVSMALGKRDECWARVPALLGGLAFVGALYFLCGPVLQWRAAAPLAALWALFNPLVVGFSQSARGYSWMLALQAILIVLAYLMAKSGRSAAIGSLAVLTAVLSLMNIVSTAVDWLIPFYASLFLIRPTRPGIEPAPDASDSGVWRKNVLLQALGIAGMAFIFFISHLASLYSSAQQYGLEFHTMPRFLELAYQMINELFPNLASKALAIAGAIGLIVLGVRRQHKFLATLTFMLLAVNLLHYLVAHKFPYARTVGHFLLIALLGAAYLVECIIGLYESVAAKTLVFGVIALLSLSLVASSWDFPVVDERLPNCLALASRVEPSASSKVYVPIRSDADYLVALYGPQNWERVEVVPGNVPLDVVLFSQDQDVTRGAPVPGFARIKEYTLNHFSGKTEPLTEKGTVPPSAWVFWYPDFTLMGINATDQMAYVQDSGRPALTQFTRYQVKLDVYSYLQCFIFIPKDSTESGTIADVVREGLRRFGGRAVIFIPKEMKVYSRGSPGAGGPGA